MWKMQILQRTSIFSIIDQPQTLWYTHSTRNGVEENKIEQNNYIPWKRYNEPAR